MADGAAPSQADPCPRRQYREPPVAEAIGRLGLSDPLPWDITTPGTLFAAFQSEYSKRPSIQRLIEAQVSGQQPEDMMGFQLSAREDRVLFTNKEESQRLAVGAKNISAHALTPYEGWESLLARLQQASSRLQDLYSRTLEVQDLGVRYVNRVVVPNDGSSAGEYFRVELGLPGEIQAEQTTFTHQWVLQTLAVPPASLNITLALAGITKETSEFILDIDLTHTPDIALSLEAAWEKIGQLKATETQAFESLITDRAREVFGVLDSDQSSTDV